MRGMHIARRVIMAMTCLFAYIVLGTSAGYLTVTFTAKVDDGFTGAVILPATSPDPFAVLNIFTALLTLILVKTMLIIDFYRHGAFTSMIVTELSALGFLDLFWMISAAYATSVISSISNFCADNTSIDSVVSMCSLARASVAFGWLNWIMLLAYVATLLTFSIMYANQNKPIWRKSVRFASQETAKPAPVVGKQGSYSPTQDPLMHVTTPNTQPISQPTAQSHMPSQMQPQVQTYGGTMYPPQPAGGYSMRAEV